MEIISVVFDNLTRAHEGEGEGKPQSMAILVLQQTIRLLNSVLQTVRLKKLWVITLIL